MDNNCTYLDNNISYHDNNTSCIAMENGGKSYNWPVLLLFIIVFVAIGGNIMVCLAVLYERKLRNMFNYFLVSLATSDMLSATLVMPVTIIRAFVGDLEVPYLMCMIWYALDVLFTSSTIIHLTMISVDRYRALKFPLQYGASKRTKHTVLKIAIVWILAFCVAGPLFALSMYDNKTHVNYKGCGPESPIFIINATVISFYLPLFIMTIMYILTVVALHKQGKTQERMQKIQRSKKKFYCAAEKKHSINHSQNSDIGSSMCIAVSVSKEYCGTMGIEDDTKTTSLHQPSHHGTKDSSTSTENSSSTPLLHLKCQNTLSPTILKRENIPLQQMAFLSPLNQPPPSTNGSPYTVNTQQSHKLDSPLPSCNTSECGESLESNSNDRIPVPVNNNKNNDTNISIKVSESIGSKLKSKLSYHKSGRRKRSKKGYSSVEKSRKAVQVLGVLFVVFLICYLPFFLTYLIKGICVDNCPFDISDSLLTVFEWMGYSGAMINPIIYHIFNKQFRRSFYRLIKCKPRRK